MRGVSLWIAVSVILFLEIGMYLPVHGVTTTLFADGFDGTSLSSAWTVSTAQTDLTDPASATVANGLLTLTSAGPLSNFLDVNVPFTPGGNNLTVAARVRADVFGRFHLALLTQAGLFDPSSVAAAFEFDLTGTLPTDCGNKGAAIERLGGSYSVFSCSTTTEKWYQLQIIATDNPYTVTWNYLNDTGGIIASTTATSAAYSFSSIKYLALGVWFSGADSVKSTYDVDWIVAASPSPAPSHAGSSGSIGIVVSPRTTSTTVKCSPTSVAVDQTTSCTATVTDTASGTPSTPTGTVSWKSDGSGVFSTTTCTLSGTGSSASCDVSYTPKAAGSQILTASYGGDSVQPSSTQPVTLVVRNNSTGGTLMLAALLGGVGAVGIVIGVTVTLLTRRKRP